MRNKLSPFQIKLHSAKRKLGFECPPEFIPVFFFARSGSTVHGATLNTHSNCLSLNEAFEHYTDRAGNPYTANMLKKSLDEILAHYENQHLPLTRRHLIGLVKQHREYQRAQRGKLLTHCFFQFNHFYFPIFQDNINFDAFFDFIGHEFPGMVFITRKNSLLRLVSGLRARELNIWHSHSLEQAPPSASIYLNPNQAIHTQLVSANGLLDYLNRIQIAEEEIRALAQQYNSRLLYLTYEDDIEPDVMIGVNKVMQFFNLPESATPLQVPIQKTSRGLKHDLLNYSDIEALLTGTPFEWMLY
ncbi:MAG: hypothetical protein FGM54_02300 [Chitinophagaceae bacterium]|nr:hypothetical protein [Chitinophagaceae bacterium]